MSAPGIAIIVAAMLAATTAMAGPLSSSEILLELRALKESARVLYVAAHPDDENTRLITNFARGRGFATAYLSLTRGDGGQNLVGPELREGLGVIRTQELLAARQLDGGQQFFTRAVDFGFSKDHAETTRIWNRREVLGDVVRIIRTYQPDIVITRFSPEPGETHGHHTASAILAREAFALAADPKEFPEQLPALAPWKTKRLFWNIFQPMQPGAKKTPLPPGALKLEVGEYLPLLGLSAGELATRSRSMHKSQGMGAIASRGSNIENFALLAGEPAKDDLFEGVAAGWELSADVDAVLKSYDPLAPEKSVPALLALRTKVRALKAGRVASEKNAQVDRILAACLGLYVETLTPAADVVPGEKLPLKHVAVARAADGVRWMGVRHPGATALTGEALDLKKNVPATRETTSTLGADTAITQPYWLTEPGTVGMYAVKDPLQIGTPENPPAYPLVQVFDVQGQPLELADEPVQVIGDPVKGELRRALRVIPPVSLELVRPLEVFTPGATRPVDVELTAARKGIAGEVRLAAPAGWQVAPVAQPYTLAAAGDTVRVSFTLVAPAAAETARVTATATVGDREYRTRRVDIRYDHIPPQIMQPPAALTAVCLDLKIRGQHVGYLPGAGDGVDVSLERMGYQVRRLTDADLSPEGLKGLDAVVIGIRAFNTRPALGHHLNGLFAWVQQGGTVVVQYNTSNGLLQPRLAPFALSLSRERVTDENSGVELLSPDHPVFNTPNKIVPADFAGWVQERGLYFPDKWGPELMPLLSMHDPGEPARKGSLLVGRHGRGWFVYSGIAWFRQLPEGVAGAYRLFANLVSLQP